MEFHGHSTAPGHTGHVGVARYYFQISLNILGENHNYVEKKNRC